MNAEAVAADASWLDRACLGEALPVTAENWLMMAAANYANDAAAESYLQQALELAPGHPAVYIAFYRFHFYHSRIRQALPYAEKCLEFAACELGLAPDWRGVGPRDAGFDDYAASGPRFYLFSLKACGYLRMRLGELESGRQALEKVRELDPADKVGAAMLLEVLQRMGRDDDD